MLHKQTLIVYKR